VVERPGDPFASLDLAVLGSAHVVSGLSCRGRVTSDVVGSGWTQAAGFLTVGVSSPGLASLTPLSGGGSGPSCSLSFSHLVPVSPDDDLPDGGLLLGFGAFLPSLDPA